LITVPLVKKNLFLEKAKSSLLSSHAKIFIDDVVRKVEYDTWTMSSKTTALVFTRNIGPRSLSNKRKRIVKYRDRRETEQRIVNNYIGKGLNLLYSF